MALSAKRYVIERARASQRALETVNKTFLARNSEMNPEKVRSKLNQKIKLVVAESEFEH